MQPKDQFPKNLPEKEPLIDIEVFRGEVGELKAKNRKHYELSRINPNDLTEEDARMWQKHKDKSMRAEEISYGSAYHNDVEKDKNNPNYSSRENLLAFFRQVLTSPQLKKQQTEHENSINGNSKK